MGNFALHHCIAKAIRLLWTVGAFAMFGLLMASQLSAQDVTVRSSQMWQDKDLGLDGDQVVVRDAIPWQTPVDHLLIDGVLWMKLVLAVEEKNVGKPVVVSLKESFPTDTIFYVYHPTGQRVSRAHMGSAVPISDWGVRPFEASHEFTPQTSGQHTVLIRIRNDQVTFLDWEVAHDFVHDAHLQTRSILFGVMMGAFAAFFIYNLILWRTLSRTIFLHFSGVIGLYAVSTLHVSGALAPLIAGMSPHLFWLESAVPCVTSGAAVLFWNVFLKRFSYQPIGKVLRAIALTIMATGLLAPFYPKMANEILVFLNPLAYTIVMVMAAVESVRKHRTGTLLFIGILPLYILMIVWHPLSSGKDLLHLSIREALPIAYVIQILIVGVGLTEGISELRQRLIAALNNRVDAMEKLVKQRTAEVENANKALKTEIAIRRNAELDAINQSRKIQDAQAQLLSSSRLRALGEMATGISHEINNPLTILKGYLYLIGNAVESSDVQIEKIGELCNKAMITTNRMVSVVKGLREFALQDEMDEATIVNVRRSWEITLNLLREKMAHTGVRYTISDFPADLAVWVRAADFTQTLLSILNFSIEATAESVERRIDVKIDSNDMAVTISISHSGLNIGAEYADQIFTPFFVNMNGPDMRSLELSIVKQLIASVGGDIRLVPNAERTTFEVILRRVYESGEKTPPPSVDKSA